MPAWLLRGLTLGVVHAAASVALAKMAVFRPTETSVATSVAFAVLIGTAVGWSAVDAWLRKQHRGRTWVIAAVITAVVAGFLDVAGRALFVDQTGVSALGDALTSGAAFVALLVLVPAGLGLFVGGRLDSPTTPAGRAHVSEDPAEETRKAQEHEERRDTDAREAQSDAGSSG